ncbi:MAG: hypothetical protein N3G79_07115 [Sulfolobales archaeon]|nr:hypothetical protein [Sulfolobales archaeon]
MSYRSDTWNVSVTLPANTAAFTRVLGTITFADVVGATRSGTVIQVPYRVRIVDIVFSTSPTPDVVVVVDKNFGQKQWVSKPASQLVVAAGRPRLNPIEVMGKKAIIEFLPFEAISIYVSPLAAVGTSPVTITFQLIVEIIY